MRNELNLKLTGAAVAFALAALAGTTHAGVPGYVSDSANTIWTSPYGLCWKTTDWTPEKAAVPCDAVRVVNAPPPPPVAVAAPPPAPVAAPAPAPTPLVTAPPAPPPIIEQISLSSDVLFEFNKAELRPSGRQKLDEIADRLKGANVQLINTIGHADRIGSDDYNKQLSEKRAASVKDYLAQKGVDQGKVRSEGRGESQPVTGDQCKGLSGAKLIACLQPDRRVDIEVRGERQVAGTPTPAGAGATGAPSSGATSGSSAAASSGSTSSSGMSPASPSGSSGSSGSSK
jgi:OOP family OmpA-OmpF porin